MKNNNHEIVSNNFLQIENILREIVEECNKLVNGDGCSIFLKDEGTRKFVLKDSTIMTPFLGNYYITVNLNERIEDNMGLTKYAIKIGEAQKIEDVSKSRFWSKYNIEIKNDDVNEMVHCELPYDEVGSMLLIPLKVNYEVIGIVRVVKQKKEDSFTNENLSELENYLKQKLPNIVGAIDISHLLKIGSILDIKDLCKLVVQIIPKMVNSEWCSIFLAEMNDDKIIYRCYGTTGLFEYLSENGFHELHNYENAYYEYDKNEIPQHLTTAVVKYKINLFLENQQECNYDKLFPEIKRKSGKYLHTHWKNRQLIPPGPAIFIPLFSPQRNGNQEYSVLGVIRITKPEGSLSFTDEEFRLCLSLSERLSKLILFSKFMSHLNKPLNISDLVESKKSIETLVDLFCEVTGAPDTTLFVKSDDGYISEKSSSRFSKKGLNEDKKVYRLPDIESEYGSSYYRGYTLWVAVFKKILMFNNDIEREQYGKYGSIPVHSGQEGCETEEVPPPKFLGVPIKGTKGELLGVLRTAKETFDPSFTDNDKMLFSSLATKISPFIESIITSKRLQKNIDIEIENNIARVLRNNVLSVINDNNDGDFFIDEQIKNFFEIDIFDEKNIGERVLKSIHYLWDESKIVSANQTPLSSFKFFDEQILAELPGYRDHFIHQYQVFLLGYYILRRLNQYNLPFQDSYCDSLKLSPKNNLEKQNIADIAWMITSTFHDIAYPLEKTETWLPKMLEDFLDEEAKDIVPKIPIEQIFFNENQKYNSFINELSKLFKKINISNEINADDFRIWLQSEVALNKDHGILGALILLKPHFLRNREIILPSALAIAMHKRLGLKIKDNGGKICYDKFPLLYLLIYCDIVQEWNRDPEDNRNKPPFLERIIVTKDFNELKLEDEKIPDEIKNNSDTIYIHSELSLSHNVPGKIKECEKWFKFCKSSNPHFSIKINNNVICSS
ncbi:MAG: GAF domain-containing protein [Thermoplasmata archaeon]|nr:MAG: GAF domain-containing protein [Thermoplasmata archaeon]